MVQNVVNVGLNGNIGRENFAEGANLGEVVCMKHAVEVIKV
jgi:hypothetical protein